MSKRKTISKRDRFEVFKRDNFTCQYCNSKPPEVTLEIDHIIPISKNGNNNMDNLITACFDCNRGKSNIILDKIPNSLHNKIENKKIAQKQYAEYQRILKKQNKLIESDIDKVENVYSLSFDGYVFTDNFRLTVKNFNNSLGVESVINAMEKACIKIYYDEQKVLKYFCGICWNKIKDNE